MAVPGADFGDAGGGGGGAGRHLEGLFGVGDLQGGKNGRFALGLSLVGPSGITHLPHTLINSLIIH